MNNVIKYISQLKNPLDSSKILELANLIIENNKDNDPEFLEKCYFNLETKLIILNKDHKIYKDKVELKKFLLERTQQHFTREFSENVNRLCGGYYKFSKEKKTLLALGSYATLLGVTFIESLKVSLKIGTNKSIFSKRMDSNLDYNETDNYLKNFYADDIPEHYKIYYFDIRIDDILLDIFIHKDLPFIEIRDNIDYSLICRCERKNYELLNENDSLDPYVIKNYRRAKLFDGAVNRCSNINGKKIFIASCTDPKHKVLIKRCVLGCTGDFRYNINLNENYK